MTMPKKKRRDMRVGGQSYHYMVTRKDEDTISVRIEQVDSKYTKTVIINGSKYFNVKPGHVKAMILAGEDEMWTNHLVRSECSCGEGIGTAVKSMCSFDVEIKSDFHPPHYCKCCEKCRARCADDV